MVNTCIICCFVLCYFHLFPHRLQIFKERGQVEQFPFSPHCASHIVSVLFLKTLPCSCHDTQVNFPTRNSRLIMTCPPGLLALCLTFQFHSNLISATSVSWTCHSLTFSTWPLLKLLLWTKAFFINWFLTFFYDCHFMTLLPIF